MGEWVVDTVLDVVALEEGARLVHSVQLAALPDAEHPSRSKRIARALRLIDAVLRDSTEAPRVCSWSGRLG